MKANSRLLCISLMVILIQTIVQTKPVHLRDIQMLEEDVESLLQGELDLLQEIRQIRQDLNSNQESLDSSYARQRRHLPRNRFAMCLLERRGGKLSPYCERLFRHRTGDRTHIVSFPES